MVMEIEVSWETDNEIRKGTEVVWDWYEIKWRINPDRIPTEEEWNECPNVFTCYSDGEKYPLAELGGRYHGKWFCSCCIQYIDEWTAGAMVWWELKRKKQSYGNAKPTKPNTKLERLQRLENAVSWAKRNGYPIQ